ncbi:MAG: DUF6290 family protein [Parachlamydia sp.]|jgi:predicted DNA-binding protein|nr:DUF6290 family protein [Parachlamydia sp.]
MPTKNPRVNVTFNPSDAEMMQMICSKKGISLSSLVRKVIEDWLEEYEDSLLAKRAEEAEKRWIDSGSPTISHEELCQELGIESNMHKMQEQTLRNSPRTSKKGLSEPSKAGSRIRRKKLENH